MTGFSADLADSGLINDASFIIDEGRVFVLRSHPLMNRCKRGEQWSS